MLLAAVALTALSALGAAESATPPRPALDLSWAATPACASRDEIEAEVARLLRAAGGDERPVRAFAALTAGENGAVEVDLRLEIAGASHQRSFEAESCQAAKSAIALILAIAVNPAAAKASSASHEPAASAPAGHDEASTSPPSASPNPTQNDTAKHATPAPPPAAIAQASRARSALSLGVSGVADLGTLPSSSPGGELELVYQLGELRIESAASFLGAQDGSDPTSDAYATFSALSGHLRLGYGAKLGKVWLGPFGSVGLLRLHASGHNGSANNFDQSVTVPEVGAGGLVSLRAAGALGVRLSAEALVPTYRPRFVVEEPTPPKQLVSQSSSVVGRVMLGVSIQFL